jgi:hypothetical protein
MANIIRRFDRAPLEGKLLRANPAQPAKGKLPANGVAVAAPAPNREPMQARRRPKRTKEKEEAARSAFATELAKAL